MDSLIEIDSTRSALADWSAPIIADVLSDLYGRRLGAESKAARFLAISHSRAWRALLLDDKLSFEQGRAGVSAVADRAGLEPDATDAMDQTVLRDLADIVITRFMRSPGRMRAYSHLLLGVSASLADARRVAA